MERKKVEMMEFVRVIVEELRQQQRVPEYERRMHKRFELMQETDIVVVSAFSSHLQIGEVFPAYLRNISRSGVALLCQIQLNRDDLIGIMMKISGKSRRVWAKVRRIGHHSPHVSAKILRMIDLGVEFYTDYKQYFAENLVSQDRQHRNRMHDILAQSGDPIAESIFTELVDIARDEVRCEAILGISKTGTADSVKLLLKLLGSNELLEIQPAHPMYSTLAGAGVLREQHQLPNTFGRANSTPTVALRHVFIADLAAYALQKITGLDLPFDMDASPDILSRQRDDWIREATSWQQAYLSTN